MITLFTRHFSKDLDKINQSSVKNEILAIIEQIEGARSLPEIKNLKKLKAI